VRRKREKEVHNESEDHDTVQSLVVEDSRSALQYEKEGSQRGGVSGENSPFS
jgi:hypothetical protein